MYSPEKNTKNYFWRRWITTTTTKKCIKNPSKNFVKNATTQATTAMSMSKLQLGQKTKNIVLLCFFSSVRLKKNELYRKNYTYYKPVYDLELLYQLY